ncbi:MAG: hypothetical protein ABI282_11490 [Candidatus Baltobacteraceae bacterium]
MSQVVEPPRIQCDIACVRWRPDYNESDDDTREYGDAYPYREDAFDIHYFITGGSIVSK